MTGTGSPEAAGWAHFLAELALERFDSRVDALVRLNMALLREALQRVKPKGAAQQKEWAAGVSRSPPGREVNESTAHLAARAALERPHPRVDGLVAVEVAALVEDLGANVTLEKNVTHDAPIV